MTQDAHSGTAQLFPAEQGAYDYLCAIYAIINARRWLDGSASNPDSIFDEPVLTLYQRLIAAACDRVPGSDLLTRGLDAQHVTALIEVAGLEYCPAGTASELDSHMLDDGSCAIIHFTYLYETRRPDHYSLLIRHAGRQALLDSYQFALQWREGWSLGFTPETELPQGANIRDCWLIHSTA